jgi:CDP-diacylglycerol--serine O-phosphatidyltransferase
MIRSDRQKPKRSRRRGRGRNRRRPLRRAVGMVKVLPSLLTLSNLLCGFMAIFYASRPFVPEDDSTHVLGHWQPLGVAAVLIYLGMLFDALDGRLARMTRQTSELGEQLDSMADMVTFGVAPAFLLVELVNIGTPFIGSAQADTFLDRAVLVIAAVYVGCCALRLARFNIETEGPEEVKHTTFKGLPSPAAGGTIAGLLLLHTSLLGEHPTIAEITGVGMVAVALLVGAAMVSTVPYSHVANRYLRGRAPFHYLAGGVIALPLLLLLPELTLAVVFSAYALSAPLGLLVRWLRRSGPTRADSTQEAAPPAEVQPQASADGEGAESAASALDR